MSSGSDFFDRLDPLGGLDAILGAMKWDADGLVTVVSQCAETHEVLGVAFADRAALVKTLETGRMHYYSRSRKKQWMKGEESGHVQHVVELRLDCDGDALVARVRQVVGNCHRGFCSCFTGVLTPTEAGGWRVLEMGEKVFDPHEAYKSKGS